MAFPEIKHLHKNDHGPVAFGLCNEAKYKASPERETFRATIQNKVARKALEKSYNNKEGSASKNSFSDTNKKTCLCSPTTHVGSFRCRLHRTASSQKWPSISLKNIAHSEQNQEAKDDKSIEFTSFDISPKIVRTASYSGNQPRVVSRFERTACDKLPFTIASSKPEQVK